MSAPPPDVGAWARSGAMHLSGRRSGPPMLAPGDPAGALRARLREYRERTIARGREPRAMPDVSLLGERGATSGLARSGPASCGGAFRTTPTTDGWFGLSLARPDDVALVGALIERDVSTSADDAWHAVECWARGVSRAEASERATLLGLPHAAWPPLPVDERAAVETTMGARRDGLTERPVVVDLSALWAGPLCAHLLGLGGCTIVKVEDPRRPDGARRAPGRFFDLLHAGHQSVAVSLEGDGPRRLLDLMLRADLVVESARPRALRQHGIIAEEVVAAGVSWLSVTAGGRASGSVGFGDDVAVAGGLAIEDQGQVLPVGDAIADPLTGAYAAAAAAGALLDDRASLIDVSMLHVVRSCAAPRRPIPHSVSASEAGWELETAEGRWPVLAPRSRPVRGQAADTGRHNDQWLT